MVLESIDLSLLRNAQNGEWFSFAQQIASETTAAQEKANASRGSVLALGERVDKVQADFKINQQHLQDTKAAVDQAALTAQRATNEAKELEDVRFFCFGLSENELTLLASTMSRFNCI